MLFLLMLVQLLDAATFALGVDLHGIRLESNGFAVLAYRWGGLDGALLLKLVVILAVLAVLAVLVLTARRYPRLLVWGAAAATAVGPLGTLTNMARCSFCIPRLLWKRTESCLDAWHYLGRAARLQLSRMVVYWVAGISKVRATAAWQVWIWGGTRATWAGACRPGQACCCGPRPRRLAGRFGTSGGECNHPQGEHNGRDGECSAITIIIRRLRHVHDAKSDPREITSASSGAPQHAGKCEPGHMTRRHSCRCAAGGNGAPPYCSSVGLDVRIRRPSFPSPAETRTAMVRRAGRAPQRAAP